MTNEEWQEIVASLVDAKRELSNDALGILDGVDGAASGVEHRLNAALAADVAAPAEVQESGTATAPSRDSRWGHEAADPRRRFVSGAPDEWHGPPVTAGPGRCAASTEWARLVRDLLHVRTTPISPREAPEHRRARGRRGERGRGCPSMSADDGG
jgi:hypothetical protein